MSVHSWWSPKTENIKGVRPYLSLFHSVIFSIKPTLILLIFFTRNVGEKKTCHIVLQQKLIFFFEFFANLYTPLQNVWSGSKSAVTFALIKILTHPC